MGPLAGEDGVAGAVGHARNRDVAQHEDQPIGLRVGVARAELASSSGRRVSGGQAVPLEPLPGVAGVR